jgi:hypothetical protein
MKNKFETMVKNLSDKDIMEHLEHYFKDVLHDWRNWGNNISKIFAEEAHRRGLIK